MQTSADISWVVIAAALVFFMQAGFALLENGMARSKNAINVIMKNYADMSFGALAFWLVGFGVMFGANPSGWLGTDHFATGVHDGRDAAFLLFQIMFAATAATIVSGAVAERMRFLPYVLVSILITTLIYSVFGSWAWGGWFGGEGWLARMGFVDFAGSTVVHSVGAWCALAAVIVIGPRLGRFSSSGAAREIPGHNLPNVALGAFILWLGWFGFNAGSTLTASPDIGPIALNTHMAAASAFVGALIFQSLTRRTTVMTTTVNAAIGGLVAITAGCASIDLPFAVLTGFVAGILVCLGQDLMARLRLDDVVGAIPVHGFCGVWGTLAAGLFHRDGLFDPDRILIQLIGIWVCFVWTFGISFILFWVMDRLIGLRADSLHEQRGLDITEHYEVGYPEFHSDLTHRGKS
ncbi:ammonium transporter [Imhoffiella purpurea]|uniref:Ammonium transporter n=1 Tax=Imhoffiella purpurea TaxID=1249627 RepID=W9VBU5_9GAMM|nr:ammonium transporter [Imhoffiella purpurea]EXJ17063.1 Ammonium transporter [Imhoffiella purpurea]